MAAQNTSIKKSIFIVAIEKSSMIIFQFVTTVILARLLTPTDYGIVAMLTIFMTLSTTIIDSGFGGSLVFYKDVTKKDYNTVFWVNILLGIFLYVLLFLSGDFISKFYSTPILSQIIKILGFTIIFNSLGAIQFTILYKNLQFKKIAYISVISYAVSAIIAIILAMLNYGLWALICQQVLYSVIKTLILFTTNKFIPDLSFSISLLKKHWKFGNGLFFSTILRIIYDNIYIQLIGKYFNVVEAGYYNQATKLKDIPTNLFCHTFDYSIFPIFSKYKDNFTFSEKYKNINNCFSFICVPFFFLLALESKTIVYIILGDKWIECSYILSILAIGSIFYTLEILNRSALKARGKTQLLFQIDLFKRILGIIIIFIFLIYLGLNGVLLSYCLNSIVGWMVNSFYLSRYCFYSFKNQMKDIIRLIVITSIPFSTILYYNLCNNEINIIYSFIKVILFILIYIIISYTIRDHSLLELIRIVKKTLKPKLIN